MSENQLLQNSLETLMSAFAEPLPTGGILAVKSGAGIGKTALLVQLAIGAMAKGERVLHINVGEQIEKVDVWYKQLFKNIAIGKNLVGANELWDAFIPHRFIMTFRVDGFSLPRLWERTNDLFVQGIFAPQIIIVDGFNVAELANLKSEFSKIKSMARANNIRVWLSVNLNEPTEATEDNDDYDVAIKLLQDGERVSLIPQKGFKSCAKFYLDPVTMLLG